jgi:hypothetical protein
VRCVVGELLAHRCDDLVQAWVDQRAVPHDNGGDRLVAAGGLAHPGYSTGVGPDVVLDGHHTGLR